MNFKRLLKASLQEEPCDLLFKNAKIANLFTMEFEKAEVAVKDGIIVGIGSGYQAAETVDCEGMVLSPGFIEGHMHIESTCMTPRNCAATLAPHGTTTAMPDPHEIANTCGPEGVRYMHRESEGLPVDFFFGAPSCVPASSHETPLEPIEAQGIKELLSDGTCTHLGEMMNFPGVIFGDEAVWKKLETAAEAEKVITGHAPGLSGPQLSAYLLGGVSSDHECGTLEEAREKLRRGMYLMIRQGATARNLSTLAPLLAEKPELACRILAVSDDITPDFILQRGELDGCLRELIACGVPPLAALRTITLTPAEYFRLYDRGAIAPGRKADLVLLESLEKGHVKKVWKEGRLVAVDGTLTVPLPERETKLPGRGTAVRTPEAEELKLKLPQAEVRVNIIENLPGSVITGTLTEPPTVRDGCAVADAERGLAKMCVVEKNRGTGKFALGFVKNFGLKKGAIASSVAHDAHNYTCAGMDDQSMAAALARLAEIRGGIVIAEGEKILAELELPAGGLMSPLPHLELCGKFSELYRAVKELGCENDHAFMQLAFLSLSVIPELKLTDQGYCDIRKRDKVPLFVL